MEKKKKIIAMGCIVLAIFAIICAIVCFAMEAPGYESSKTYGGDAYTGMQQASAQTANNVKVLVEHIDTVSGLAFLFAAGVLFLVGIAQGTFGKKEKPQGLGYTTVNKPQEEIL